jgi:hypothetical protein
VPLRGFGAGAHSGFFRFVEKTRKINIVYPKKKEKGVKK